MRHEQTSKCLSSQLPVLCSNLSLVLPKPGNASFPEETKLLLYHSGPQVFQCSLTVSCKRRERGTRTQMLFVMPVHFQKTAGCPITESVPNWHGTAVCTDKCWPYRHNETLFVLWYWIPTSFCQCSFGSGADIANRDQRHNVLHMPGWPPFCWGQPQRLGKVHMIQNSKWFHSM